MKALLLVRPLLWQNRWLLLMLALWPYGMAALLLIPDRHPAGEDVLAVLQQECLYGVALVAFNGASLLGNEQRSRRIVTVLSRGIGRSEYLFALLLAAWLPLLVYVTGFTIAGCALVSAAGKDLAVVWKVALLQLAVGAWIACAGLLYSLFLPSILASLAALATASAMVYFSLGGPGTILAGWMHMTLAGALPGGMRDGLLSLTMAAVLFALASMFFARRDLDLKSD